MIINTFSHAGISTNAEIIISAKSRTATITVNTVKKKTAINCADYGSLQNVLNLHHRHMSVMDARKSGNVIKERLCTAHKMHSDFMRKSVPTPERV